MHEPTNIQFKLLSAAETYAVRHPVLRNGLPESSCAFDRDDMPTTIHLGAIVGGKLVGVLSLLPNETAVQLRGMAVLETYQGKGIGKRMLQKAEELVHDRGMPSIWMNARLIAIPFYKACGYQQTGTKFVLPYGGEHYKMIKS